MNINKETQDGFYSEFVHLFTARRRAVGVEQIDLLDAKFDGMSRMLYIAVDCDTAADIIDAAYEKATTTA